MLLIINLVIICYNTLLGYNKFYKVTTPFIFMDTIGIIHKTNFHEQLVKEYKSPCNFNTSKEFINIDDFKFLYIL